MASLEEQETTITFGRTEDVARVYTSDSRHLWRLREDDRATETDGGEDWATFTVPTSQVSPLKFFKSKRAPMSDEQRKAAGERLRAARLASQSDPA